MNGVGVTGNHTNAFYRVFHDLANGHEFPDLMVVSKWEGWKFG